MIERRSGNCNLSNCKAVKSVPIGQPSRSFQNDKEKIWIFSWEQSQSTTFFFSVNIKLMLFLYNLFLGQTILFQGIA